MKTSPMVSILIKCYICEHLAANYIGKRFEVVFRLIMEHPSRNITFIAILSNTDVNGTAKCLAWFGGKKY